MGRKVSDGKSVSVVVPQSTDIIPGTWYFLDGFVGPAFERVTTAAGVTSRVAIGVEQGEYETSQINAADAFAKGDDVYFDTVAGLFRSVAHAANAPATSILVGRVTVAKDANDVVQFVRTNLTS